MNAGRYRKNTDRYFRGEKQLSQISSLARVLALKHLRSVIVNVLENKWTESTGILDGQGSRNNAFSEAPC